MNKAIPLLLAISLASVSGHADSGLTLEEALQTGLANNPTLKVNQAAREEAKWKKRESLGAYLPKVDLVGSHFFELKYQQIQISPVTVFESIYPKTTYGAEASLNLFDGGKTTYNYKASSAQLEAADFELNQASMAVENTIKLKFYQALGAQVLAEVAKSNVKTLTDHLKRAQELLKQGEFTKVDVLKVQVQLEQAIPEELAALDTAILARKQLAEAMAMEGDDRALLSKLPTPDESVVKNLDHNDKGLAKGRLDLLALQKRAEAADDTFKASKSIWMPRINLIANYQYYNNRNFSFSETEKFRNAYALGMNFTWNLFEGGSSYARLQESFYQKIQQEEKRRRLELSSSNDVEFWKRRYTNSAILYAAKLRSVDASKESVRIYQNGLKAGTRTNSDLLDAELDLERSEAGVVKAQVDAVEAKLNLELAIGRRI